MAITFVGAGVVQAGTAGLTVPVPSGIAAHDALVLLVVTNAQAIAAPSGWTEMRTTNTTGVSSQAFIKDAVGNETTQAVVDSGNWTKAVMLAFRGVDLSGSKFDASADVSIAANNTTANVPQTTAATTNEFWVAVGGTNVNPGTLNFTSGTLTSNAGKVQGDANGAIAYAYGTLTASGLTASPLATLTTSTSGRLAVAGGLLKPLPTAAIGGTLKQLTGAVAVSNKESMTLAGTMGQVTAAVAVTISASGISAALAGTLMKLTGAISETQKTGHVIAGTLMKLTGSISESHKLAAVVTGTLGQLTSAIAANVDIPATIGGVLAQPIGSVVMDLRQGLFVQGALAPLTGDVHASITLPSGAAAIVGTLPSLTGSVVASTKLGLAVSGSLKKLTGSIVASTKQRLALAGVLKKATASISMDVDTGTTTEPGSTTEPETCYDLADDRRERILARLAVVLGGLGVEFGRNDPVIPETLLPKITMFDADEDANRDVFDRGRPPNGPNRIGLTPEVYITLAADTPEEAGTALNVWVNTITSAVLNDATLVSLAVDGKVEFNGAETAVESARMVVGQASIDFTIWYRLQPEAPCVVPTVDVGSAVGREAIMLALGQIVGQTEGVVSWARNDLSAPDDDVFYPRVILLDGRESVDPSTYQGRTRPPNSPRRVFMEPELYILAEGDVTTAGPKLNQIRLMLLRSIMNEPVLASLAMDDDIRYEGCQTAMAGGRGMTGEMGMVISLARVMRP